VYFIQDAVVTEEDILLARSNWNMIVGDTSPAYKHAKDTIPNFEPASCVSWFYTIFYERLFNVHPMCQPLFTTGLVGQGKFLVKMMSITLSQLGDQSKFCTTMEGLAKSHCERGVRGVEFGIVGDVLFYSLMKTLGDEFTIEAEYSWKKIYSVMLRIIVPLCISYERTGVLPTVELSSQSNSKSASAMNTSATKNTVASNQVMENA
jgi:hemoglobin-like flavoprotein